MVKLLHDSGNVFLCLVLAFFSLLSIPAVSDAGNKQIVTAMDAIQRKIRQKIIQPINIPPSATTAIDVDVQDTGYVTRVRLLKTSGYPNYDEAVMEAVIAAQPLPVPRTVATRKDFTELTLTFTSG